MVLGVCLVGGSTGAGHPGSANPSHPYRPSAMRTRSSVASTTESGDVVRRTEQSFEVEADVGVRPTVTSSRSSGGKGVGRKRQKTAFSSRRPRVRSPALLGRADRARAEAPLAGLVSEIVRSFQERAAKKFSREIVRDLASANAGTEVAGCFAAAQRDAAATEDGRGRYEHASSDFCFELHADRAVQPLFSAAGHVLLLCFAGFGADATPELRRLRRTRTGTVTRRGSAPGRPQTRPLREKSEHFRTPSVS